MTRTATTTMRKIAMIVAGGSFALGLAPALQAQPDDGVSVADRAAVLNIAPLRFEFSKDEATATLRLTNTSARDLPVQTRVFAWTQDGGEDTYAPSTDLTVSPSIISIPAGQTQIVRVMRRSAPGQGEKRFRLAVDQLPDPDAAKFGGADALIRFTIPVFADRETAAPARLDWRIAADRIELVNAGGQTSRVAGIKVTTSGGREIEVERNSLRYVQGSSTIAWPIQGGCGLGRVKITAQLDGQTVDVEPQTLCS